MRKDPSKVLENAAPPNTVYVYRYIVAFGTYLILGKYKKVCVGQGKKEQREMFL